MMINSDQFNSLMAVNPGALFRPYLAVLYILVLILGSYDSLARYNHGRDTVMAMVAEEARAQGVDPALALAQVGSSFNPQY